MKYIDLFYCDESHFGLTPNIGYAWQHKDNPILLPAAKGQRLSVFGLMNPDCKLCSWMVEGSINSDAVIAILDEFATQINKKTVVVIDNAPIHRSKKFIAKIAEWEQQDLLIYFLPPYCPELNLIEILWKQIKYYGLPFDAFLNFQNLKERLSNTLNQIGSKCQIKFCGLLKSNMKNKLMSLYDKIMLRKRSVIETINDQLKNICDIEHTSHRSIHNFFVNLIAALGAYSFFDKKPSIRMQTKTDSSQLALLF